MIKLKDVNEWLRTEFSTKFDNYYIGFLDKKKEKSLGVYHLKRNKSPIMALGGLDNTSYSVKQISLLIHYTNASDETEDIADKLYQELLVSHPEQIGDHKVFFIGMLTDEPIDVGRDDNGICEYVIEFEIYYERQEV